MKWGGVWETWSHLKNREMRRQKEEREKAAVMFGCGAMNFGNMSVSVLSERQMGTGMKNKMKEKRAVAAEETCVGIAAGFAVSAQR